MTNSTPTQRWQKYLFHASRSRSFLWKMSFGLLISGAIIGYAGSWHRSSPASQLGERILGRVGLAAADEADEPEEGDPQKTPLHRGQHLDWESAFESELSQPGIGCADMIRSLPVVAARLDRQNLGQVEAILRRHFSPTESALAVNYLRAWKTNDSAAEAAVRASALASRPVPLARYALGNLEFRRQNFALAAEHFAAETTPAIAVPARRMHVAALVEAGDEVALARLQSDPDYREYFSRRDRLELAIRNRDWRGVLKAVPLMQIESYGADVMYVSLVAGVAWAFFLAHLGEWPRFFSRTMLLCLLGFVAGFASTTPTLWLVVFEDDFLHIAHGHDLVHAVAYCIGGVAVREELCKLLLFLPLLPFLRRRDDELEVLIVAGFVGLGFAVEENGSYFMASAASAATGRFLSANFFHIALTGLNGLAAYRAVTRGWPGVNEFFFVLAVTILAHGGYDGLIEAKDLQGAGYIAMAIYVAFALYFFQQVEALRSNRRMTISLTGALVFGVSVLSAVTVAFQMIKLGPAAGSTLIFGELLSSGLMLLMFFRVFNEPLTP